MSAEKSKRMIDNELLINFFSLKFVCMQIVLSHVLFLFFRSDELAIRCLLGLKLAIFLRGGALFICM